MGAGVVVCETRVSPEACDTQLAERAAEKPFPKSSACRIWVSRRKVSLIETRDTANAAMVAQTKSVSAIRRSPLPSTLNDRRIISPNRVAAKEMVLGLCRQVRQFY